MNCSGGTSMRLVSWWIFLLDDVFLHFDCVDDVLSAHVHTLLCLFFRLNDGYLNDLLSE